jgi:Zn-dependent protease with chaperone function
MTETFALAIWLILLALAFPYVRRAKHPDTPTLAAFLLFVMLFSVVSTTLFFVLSGIAASTGWASALTKPFWALLFLALVFLPAFLFARWMIKRPPWNRPVPK